MHDLPGLGGVHQKQLPTASLPRNRAARIITAGSRRDAIGQILRDGQPPAHAATSTGTDPPTQRRRRRWPRQSNKDPSQVADHAHVVDPRALRSLGRGSRRRPSACSAIPDFVGCSGFGIAARRKRHHHAGLGSIAANREMATSSATTDLPATTCSGAGLPGKIASADDGVLDLSWEAEHHLPHSRGATPAGRAQP